jgi:hypothetical protein
MLAPQHNSHNLIPFFFVEEDDEGEEIEERPLLQKPFYISKRTINPSSLPMRHNIDYRILLKGVITCPT